MAKKKIYAVRKGHKTGLFATWAECQKAVSGYSGAEFRGFTEKEEALAFLNMETTGNVSGDKAKEAAGIVEVPENMVIAYVDGSFEKSIGRYAFGCVILTPDGQEIRKSGSGSDSAGVAIRNVAGEMLGSMTAVNWAIENKYPAVEIRYDYEAGRSDFPNQVNNVLCFPGLFKGALSVRARDINDAMKLAAAYAIADLITDEDRSEENIIPGAFDPRVAEAVASAVAKAARETGVARL